LFLDSAELALHRQVLSQLRVFRNAIVRHATWSRETEQLICRLKLYVDHLLACIIRRGHYFKNVDEIGQFLDLPRSRELLLKGAAWLK
jgi:hypothetical protein